MCRFLLLGLALLLFRIGPAVAEQPSREQFAEDFWAHWGDGKAEVAGYDLSFPRYGEIRRGVAVAIFVTETFSNSLRVKADPGNYPETDEFPVMKLNLVQDFPTGIYDYNLMTSSFVNLTELPGMPRGSVVKVSHATQEWCGQVWLQLVFHRESVDYTLHSYFDGEADQQLRLQAPSEPLSEDVALLWARGLAGPFLVAGESAERPWLGSAQGMRLRHEDVGWTVARLSRVALDDEITVPAGSFIADECRIDVGGERRWTIHVERAKPHRVLRWDNAQGQRAELLGADRLRYWELNGTQDQAMLERLGLVQRPERSP